MTSRFRALIVVALVVSGGRGAASVWAGEPFRFPEGRHSTGELKYRRGIPVLRVEGTPEEIGEQVAVLVSKPCKRLLSYPKEVLAYFATPAGAKVLWPGLVKKGQRLLENFPADYRAEFEAMVKVSGFDREAMMMGNTAFDLKEDLAALFGCSALMVEAERSATGRPILGRNMDHFALGYLHEYSLVTVYRPKGKHAFTAVGYPGLVGCISGINDKGLVVAVLESTGTNAGEGPAFNPEGVPFALNYRRLLEECTTIPEAAASLRKMKRTTTNLLAVADATGTAVFEITPSRMVVRNPQQGIGTCTNHFLSSELKLAKPKNLFTTMERLAALERARGQDEKLGVAEVQHYLDAANQGKNTLQTMIFEPANLTLHVAFAVGETPSSSRKLQRLDLTGLLDPKPTSKD
jgi:hypothetical protein